MKKSLYEIIQNDFKHKIETGVLKKDEKLPSEDKMRKIYNVSKVTLRKALRNLIDEGYLYAQPRVGYFVSIPSNDGFILQYDIEIVCTESISKIELIDISLEENSYFYQLQAKEIRVTNIYYVDDIIGVVEFCSIPIRYSFKNGEKKKNLLDYYNEIYPEIYSYAAKKELEITATNGDEKICSYLECFEDDPLLQVSLSYYDDYNRLFAHKSAFFLEEYAFLNAYMEKNKN